jgi:hypothetical protein
MRVEHARSRSQILISMCWEVPSSWPGRGAPLPAAGTAAPRVGEEVPVVWASVRLGSAVRLRFVMVLAKVASVNVGAL